MFFISNAIIVFYNTNIWKFPLIISYSISFYRTYCLSGWDANRFVYILYGTIYKVQYNLPRDLNFYWSAYNYIFLCIYKDIGMM